MKMKTRKVFLCSNDLGCPANLAWTTQLHNYVTQNSWAFQDAGAAELIIIVCCIILVEEHRKAVGAAVRHFSTRYPRKKIIVTGCFVDEDFADAPNVVCLPMSRPDAFDALLKPAVPLRDAPSVSTPEMDLEVRALRGGKAAFNKPYHVLASTGCLNRCSYCIEQNLFSRVRSVPIDEVVARCQDGIRKGYTNFIIGSTDLSSYGHDLGCDVADLISALFSRAFDGERKIGVGFKAFEPSRFIKQFPRLRKYFQTGMIDWIYLPIESGSDSVLRSMRRPYRVKDVLKVVKELRRAAPALRIETDFVFCYPTETKEDFEASLRLLELFDHRTLVVFSRHKDTPAFAMKDVFSPEEKARRCEVVRALNASVVPSYRAECDARHEVPPASPGAAPLYVLAPPRRAAGA